MGVVYRAYDPGPMDRELAVKTRHEFEDPSHSTSFTRSAAPSSPISHPNIVEIFDMGEVEEGGQKRPYFVMPLLPDQMLDELIRVRQRDAAGHGGLAAPAEEAGVGTIRHLRTRPDDVRDVDRRQPFRLATESEVVDAIQNNVPPPASTLNPAVVIS